MLPRPVAALLAAGVLVAAGVAAAGPSPAAFPGPPAATPSPVPAGARPSSDVLEAPVLPAPTVPVTAIPVPDPGVTVIATPAAAGVARDLASRLPGERADLARILGADLVAPVEIRFGHGRSEFDGLLPGGAAPGWASGLAYPALGLVIVDVQASGRGANVGQVLRHEIAHVALGRAGGARLPRWFSEGFAILHSGEWSLSRSVVLARAVGANALLPVEDLERGWPSSPTDVDLAYAQSVSLVTFLLRVDEGAAVHRLVAGLGAGRDFDAAFAAAFGQPIAGAEIDWKRSLRTRWGWLPVAFDPNLIWIAAAILVALGALRVHLHHRRRIAALPDDAADDPGPDADDPSLEPNAEPIGPVAPSPAVEPNAEPIRPVAPASAVESGDAVANRVGPEAPGETGGSTAVAAETTGIADARDGPPSPPRAPRS